MEAYLSTPIPVFGAGGSSHGKQMVRPNLSLNPDASPAALARRSLGAG